jgi:hypothetical protein
MGLREELERVGERAGAFVERGEVLAGVLPTEPGPGRRVYLCAYVDEAGGRTWLALDGEGATVANRTDLREAASIAALCELAEETAGGGDLEELRGELVALRLREHPPGIEEAEEAALELERTLAIPPRLATPSYLDAVGSATRRLEQALGDGAGGSPFTAAMKQGMVAVEELTAEVEGRYKLELA